MNHIPAKVKVFQTTDYKRFTNIDGNRPLNKKKIQRIIDDIKSGNDILDEVQDKLKETHFIDGVWNADYKRIRIVAVKDKVFA